MQIRPSVIHDLKACVGRNNVLTQRAELMMYSFDAALERGMPSLVILPKSPDQVIRVVGVLARHKIPFIARGAATSLCGGPVPTQEGVVISLTRLKKIGKVDPVSKKVTVDPGVVNLKLQELVAQDGLFYPPDPGSQKACTIGGNVATNAGGPHCLKYGVTSHYVEGLDLVLPDGRTARVHVNDPGYDLVGLFVGSEGTLGVATKIRLKLLPIPPFVRTMLVSFPSIEDAIKAVSDIIAAGILPATLEAMDKTVVAAIEAFAQAGYPLEAEAVLLIEVDGDQMEEMEIQSGKIRTLCESNKSFDFRIAADPRERAKLWEGRRGSYPAMARLAPNVLVEDGAVPRTKLPEALRKIKEIAAHHGVTVALLFHAGDGNLHPQIIFDERDKDQTRVVKKAGHEMLKACVDLGGTISGEHGIGTDKREAMKWLFNRDTLSLFRRIKNVFDKENICNPDKLIPLISKAKAPPKEKKKDEEEPFSPVGMEQPATEEELLEIVTTAADSHRQFGIQGTTTKLKVKENMIVHVAKLNKILDFDKGNLTLQVQAGASIEQIKKEIEPAHQYLWVSGTGSIGGIIATKSSSVPPLRNLILGMRVLLPTGEIVEFGAKTMKNVAGYDAARLLIGSWGTLGIILDVTFRLFPYPFQNLKSEKTEPFVFRDLHKTVKKAFDPSSLLFHRLVNMSREEIKELLKVPLNKPGSNTPPPEPGSMDSMVDKFWSG